MESLKFPLQDPLQQVASSNTTTISNKLICNYNRIALLHLHPTFIRNYPTRSTSLKNRRSVATCYGKKLVLSKQAREINSKIDYVRRIEAVWVAVRGIVAGETIQSLESKP